jgi:hypothetical protein
MAKGIHSQDVRHHKQKRVEAIPNILCADTAKEWKIKLVRGHCVGDFVCRKRTRRGNLLLRIITGPSKDCVRGLQTNGSQLRNLDKELQDLPKHGS